MMDPKCKKDPELRYLWHLSCSTSLGKEFVIMKPRTYGPNRGESEPKNRRFCCSISPAGGFVAIPIDYTDRKYHLYRSVKKVASYKTYNVPDAGVTGERWLFEDTEFKKIITLSPLEFAEYYELLRKYRFILGVEGQENFRRQRNAAKAILRKLDREYFICR